MSKATKSYHVSYAPRQALIEMMDRSQEINDLTGLQEIAPKNGEKMYQYLVTEDSEIDFILSCYNRGPVLKISEWELKQYFQQGLWIYIYHRDPMLSARDTQQIMVKVFSSSQEHRVRGSSAENPIVVESSVSSSQEHRVPGSSAENPIVVESAFVDLCGGISIRGNMTSSVQTYATPATNPLSASVPASYTPMFNFPQARAQWATQYNFLETQEQWDKNQTLITADTQWRAGIREFQYKAAQNNLDVNLGPDTTISILYRVAQGLEKQMQDRGLTRDLCKYGSVCNGNLGLLRTSMPQLSGEQTESWANSSNDPLVKFLKPKEAKKRWKKNPIIFTQTEINVVKTLLLLHEYLNLKQAGREGESRLATRPLLVASVTKNLNGQHRNINAIMDGHHRAAAIAAARALGHIITPPLFMFVLNTETGNQHQKAIEAVLEKHDQLGNEYQGL